jgi:carbohydrate-binding DOMON domain-containing protein
LKLASFGHTQQTPTKTHTKTHQNTQTQTYTHTAEPPRKLRNLTTTNPQKLVPGVQYSKLVVVV